VIAGALGLYAYLQIKDVVDSYANPVTNRKEVKQDSVALPGLLLCMPSNDVTLASSFSAPKANQVFCRILFQGFVAENTVFPDFCFVSLVLRPCLISFLSLHISLISALCSLRSLYALFSF
jgi:hypothetical protein